MYAESSSPPVRRRDVSKHYRPLSSHHVTQPSTLSGQRMTQPSPLIGHNVPQPRSLHHVTQSSSLIGTQPMSTSADRNAPLDKPISAAANRNTPLVKRGVAIDTGAGLERVLRESTADRIFGANSSGDIRNNTIVQQRTGPMLR